MLIFQNHQGLILQCYENSCTCDQFVQWMWYRKKESASNLLQLLTDEQSDLGGILTHDLQNRNLTLYTAKLRGRVANGKDGKRR